MIITISTFHLLILIAVAIGGVYLLVKYLKNINKDIAIIYSIRCTANYTLNNKVMQSITKEYSYVDNCKDGYHHKSSKDLLDCESRVMVEELVHSYFRNKKYELEIDKSNNNSVDLFVYNDKESLDITCELLEQMEIIKDKKHYDYILQYRKY